MKALTAEEALDFSIKKWEIIVKNDGKSPSKEQSEAIGISHLHSTCGLCEKYIITITEDSSRVNFCINCPFNNGHGNGCSNYNHVWAYWNARLTTKAAQIVLDALKQLK